MKTKITKKKKYSELKKTLNKQEVKYKQKVYTKKILSKDIYKKKYYTASKPIFTHKTYYIQRTKSKEHQENRKPMNSAIQSSSEYSEDLWKQFRTRLNI